MRPLLAVLGFGILTSLATSTAFSGIADDRTPAQLGAWDQFQPGDIIARGEAGIGTCEYEAAGVQTEAPGDGMMRWMRIAFTPTCEAVVVAKGTRAAGDFQDLPVAHLLDDLNSPGPVQGETPAPDAETSPDPRRNPPTGPGGITINACETSEQHVFMYGLGGTWDSLTHKNGKLVYCWNGSTATTSSQSGTCQGSDPPGSHYWNNDACVLVSNQNGPAGLVYRQGRGDYHCEPPGTWPCTISSPDGYYHSLFDDEEGNYAGVSNCRYWYTGIIVTGISHEVYSGCT